MTFQKFSSQSEAKELMELLTENNIVFLFEDTSDYFDPTFANNEFTKEYIVKLKKEDFEKANKILLDISEQQLDKVNPDYYLFDFTNKELIEIIVKSDEWGKFDYLLAQRILKNQGQEISKESLETFQKNRIEELARPENSPKDWIIYGYLSSAISGFLGIYIGWYLSSRKKILPNGDKVYVFSIQDRKHGKRIFILGILVLTLICLTLLRNLLKE